MAAAGREKRLSSPATSTIFPFAGARNREAAMAAPSLFYQCTGAGNARGRRSTYRALVTEFAFGAPFSQPAELGRRPRGARATRETNFGSGAIAGKRRASML